MFKQISTGYLQCAINLGIDKADQTVPPREVIAPYCFNFKPLSRGQWAQSGGGGGVGWGIVSMFTEHP